jgi:hypothetical protein
MSKIVVIKLSEGSEIVSQMSKVDEKTLLHKPRVLQIMPSQSGYQVGLVPFFISNPDGDCIVNDNHITSIIEAPKQIEDAYLRNTSGIEIATSLTENM